MSDITIPPEALEAAAFHLPGYHSRNLWPHIEAACLAMLKAWPEAFQTTTQINRDATEVLILPLTQENNNGAARLHRPPTSEQTCMSATCPRKART